MSIIKRLKEVQSKFFAWKILNYKIFAYVFSIRFKSNKLYNDYSKQQAHVVTMKVSKKIIFECFAKFKNSNNEDKTYRLL